MSILSVWPSFAWAHGAEEYIFIFLPIVGGVALAIAGIATLIYGLRLKNQRHPGPLHIQILKYFFKTFLLICLVLIIIWGFLRILSTLLV